MSYQEVVELQINYLTDSLLLICFAFSSVVCFFLSCKVNARV
jgi:hypothetical protein